MLDLKKLRRILGYTQKDMANILGIKQNAYSSIETGKVSLTDRNKNILVNQLHLNMDWLDDIENSMPYSDKDSCEEIKPRPLMYLDTERLAAQLSAIPDKDIKPKNTRPRIPLTAAAGSLSNAAKGVTLRDCEQMPIVKQFPSYDFTMFVKGDSMSPKYESGDEIACRWIDQSRFIQWGKIHVLDTTQGIIVKKVYDDGDKIRCVSINTDYPAFSIPKEDIYSMALVIGALNISEM